MSIFISYNSRDGVQIPREIKNSLDLAIGECAFWDRASIRPGTEWREAISGGLRDAKVLVLVAGPRFFLDDEIERLERRDSVIRFELETARRSSTCQILPVYFESLPPHRSGKSWPVDFEWLGNLQWTEISQDRVVSDCKLISNEICRLLAGDFLLSLGERPSISRLIEVVDSGEPTVLKALSAILEDPVGRRKQLAEQIEILGQIKFRSFPNTAAEVLESRSVLTLQPAWIESVYLLALRAHLGHSSSQVDVERVDHQMRNEIKNRKGLILRGSQDQQVDFLVSYFISTAIRRMRERQDKMNYSAAESLREVFALVRQQSPRVISEVSRTVAVLLKWNLLCDQDDRKAFEGRGHLASFVKMGPPRRRRQTQGRTRKGKSRKRGSGKPRKSH